METTKKKPMRRFRLRRDAGPHFEPNVDFDPDLPEDEDNPRDIEFGPGKVVKSRRNLVKLFPNKFMEIGDDGHAVEEEDSGRPVRSAEARNVSDRNRHLSDEELSDKEWKKNKKKKAAEQDEGEDEEVRELEGRKRKKKKHRD